MVEIEPSAEEILEVIKEAEEEIEIIPYEPPEEVKAAEQPLIRFAEDIFIVKDVSPDLEGKKKGKKKKTARGEKAGEDKTKKRRKTHLIIDTPDEDDEYSE